MKNKLLPLALAFALTSSSSFGTEKISGSMQILNPTTNQEIKIARIGEQVKVVIAVNNLNLIANKNVNFSYALSVLPEGSNTPISFSGKISGPFKLPASEGGEGKTQAELASWEGMQVGLELITIPDVLPAGKATLSVSLTGNKIGSITFNKKLNILL